MNDTYLTAILHGKEECNCKAKGEKNDASKVDHQSKNCIGSLLLVCIKRENQ